MPHHQTASRPRSPGLDDTMFARPPVFATPTDYSLLQQIVRSSEPAPGLSLLLDEVSRMEVLPGGAIRGFVRLGSTVTYKDLRTKRERTIHIAAPFEADPDDNRVSVLSPIGAALIGLSEGAIIRWSGGDGAVRAVKVLRLHD